MKKKFSVTSLLICIFVCMSAINAYSQSQTGEKVDGKSAGKALCHYGGKTFSQNSQFGPFTCNDGVWNSDTKNHEFCFYADGIYSVGAEIPLQTRGLSGKIKCNQKDRWKFIPTP